MVSQSYYLKKNFVKSFSPLRRKTAKLRHNKSWTMNNLSDNLSNLIVIVI